MVNQCCYCTTIFAFLYTDCTFPIAMSDLREADPEKERKRKKALRRMGKILGRAWELPHAEHFHGSLGAIGEKIDQEAYRYGRHGWEDFAKDIGGVYNRHIHR